MEAHADAKLGRAHWKMEFSFLEIPKLVDDAPCAFLLAMQQYKLRNRKALTHRILDFAYLPKVCIDRHMPPRRGIWPTDTDFDEVRHAFSEFSADDCWHVIEAIRMSLDHLGSDVLPSGELFNLQPSSQLLLVDGRLHSARSWIQTYDRFMKISDVIMDCTDHWTCYRYELLCIAWVKSVHEDEVLLSARGVLHTVDYNTSPLVGKYYSPNVAPHFELSWKPGCSIVLTNFDFRHSIAGISPIGDWSSDIVDWIESASSLARSSFRLFNEHRVDEPPDANSRND